MVSWGLLACLVAVEILLVSGKSVLSAGLRVQTEVGSHVAKSPISSTKPTDSDSLTSTSSSEIADSSSSKADPKIRQVNHDSSSSVALVAVVGVIIFGVAAVAIFVAVYCYIRVSRSKKAADRQETRVLNSKRNGTQAPEFSSESL